MVADALSRDEKACTVAYPYVDDIFVNNDFMTTALGEVRSRV